MAGKDDKSDLPKLFVGCCRLALVDSDGHERPLRGCAIEAPIHESTEEGHRVLVSDFPDSDPLDYFAVPQSDNQFLKGVWWVGAARKSPSDHINPNRVICKLVNTSTVTVLSNMPDGQSKFTLKALVPFIPDCKKKPVQVTFTTTEYRLSTRVSRVEVRIPEEVYTLWEKYFKAIKDFEKEDKDKDEEKKDDKEEKPSKE